MATAQVILDHQCDYGDALAAVQAAYENAVYNALRYEQDDSDPADLARGKIHRNRAARLSKALTAMVGPRRHRRPGQCSHRRSVRRTAHRVNCPPGRRLELGSGGPAHRYPFHSALPRPEEAKRDTKFRAQRAARLLTSE